MEANATPTVLEYFHLLPEDGHSRLIRASHRCVAPGPDFMQGDPNHQAAKIIGFPADSWCHSTSWRTQDAKLVLTFLVLSAADSHTWDAQVEIDPARWDKELAPQRQQVFAHALGHLRYLAARHPELPGLIAEHRLMHTLEFDPVTAGHYAGSAPGTPARPAEPVHGADAVIPLRVLA